MTSALMMNSKILVAPLRCSVLCILLLLLHCSGGHGIHEEEEGGGNQRRFWPSKVGDGVQGDKRGRELMPLISLNQSLHIDRYIVVDKNGGGDYKKVQDAIDSVPNYNKGWVYIQINAGVYKEKVTISYTQPYIILQGAGMTSTIISWGDTASSLGTANSATFTANGDSFIAKGIGFHNSAPAASPGAFGGQAVAVLAGGDMMAFYKCGFYGAQDTLFDALGRHYFKNCYIEGSIDFIFGHGRSTYKGCELMVKAEEGYISGSITAQNRDEANDMGGFVFVECNITGTGEVFLGRAWGAYSRVVFMYTSMSSVITPQGWFDWGKPSRQSTVYYGEYKCFGPGADDSKRVSWCHQLNDEEAAPFLQISYIDGESWLQET